MEENPFPGTKIADWTFLESAPRAQCPKCLKSRKYYCYNCFIPLPCIASLLPIVKLPVHVDIIKHPMEVDGKSTSSHAAILAPDDVTIYTYPCIPDYDSGKVLVVFPSSDSKTLSEIASLPCGKTDLAEITQEQTEKSLNDQIQHSKTLNSAELSLDKKANDETHSVESLQPECDSNSHSKSLKRQLCDVVESSENANDNLESHPPKQILSKPLMNFNRVVFIDSTWNQCHTIINDERLQDLQQVELKSRTSNFWRCQENKPNTFLSTIEAIYYFMRDLHNIFICSEYNHEYDNLLFFFCHQYSKIRLASQGGNKIKSYKRK